ncbi:hypothetical protein [Nostoc piscinale]|nr:hypothetical protein [Nostoc piscinale]
MKENLKIGLKQITLRKARRNSQYQYFFKILKSDRLLIFSLQSPSDRS